MNYHELPWIPVLSKLKTIADAREISRRFRTLVIILSLNDKIIDLALNDSKFTNFEDGLQYYSAMENNQDFIITRDLKGFKNSKLPEMSPEEYLTSTEH